MLPVTHLPRHSYHCVLLDPPVRRPARLTIIITNIDTELVAVSLPRCGSRLDDYLPAAHVLAVGRARGPGNAIGAERRRLRQL